MIDLTKWKLYKNYSYNEDIEPLQASPDHSRNDSGKSFEIGKTFLSLSDDRDNTLSFVLTNWNDGSIYKLIWKG